MELPFLKNTKNKQGGGGPIERQARTKDMDDDKGLMDQVADEFMAAMEKKDRAMLMDALRALVLYIQDEDQASDMEGMGQ